MIVWVKPLGNTILTICENDSEQWSNPPGPFPRDFKVLFIGMFLLQFRVINF